MIQLSFYVEAEILREHKRTLKRSMKSPEFYNFHFDMWLTECLTQKLTELPCPLNFIFRELELKWHKSLGIGYCAFTINFECRDYSEIKLSDIKTEFLDKYVKSVYNCLETVELDASLNTSNNNQLEASYKLQTNTYSFCLYDEAISEIQFSLFA
jgi:hypothetical protein